jgi:hypothetical protein
MVSSQTYSAWERLASQTPLKSLFQMKEHYLMMIPLLLLMNPTLMKMTSLGKFV